MAVELQNNTIEQNGYRYSLKEELLSRVEIEDVVRGLASRITEDYKDKNPIFIIILNGALVFGRDLIGKVKINTAQYDIMAISSYKEGTESSKQPIITKDIKINIEDRHVIVVEDIVDTGWSIDRIIKLLKSRSPASLAVCSLLNKKERREIEVPIEYEGIEIPNKFIVGYGLDVDELFRLLPNLCVAEKVDLRE